MTKRFFAQIGDETSILPTRNRRRLAGIILVIDGRHPGLNSDQAAYAWVRQHDFPAVIVTTKNDRMSRKAQAKSRREHERALGEAVIATSSKTGAGTKLIWTAIGVLL